jgi:signal transduction histidine kinase/CheY-like chemotaxis protein
MIHPDDRERAWAHVQEAIDRGEEEYYHEYRLLRPDGATRWIASRGRILRDLSGEAEHLVGVSLDITERRMTEEALRDADRRKDEFLAMLAHELRNPLAAIASAIRLSQSATLADGDRNWVEQTLHSQVQQLARLVDDLLDVARITRGRIELKPEAHQLADLVRRTIDGARPLLERARHTLEVELPDEPLWISADAARMQQAFSNLLTNAIKYTRDGGRIAIRAAREGNTAAIAIRDNGIGISPEMLPRVFDLFSQAEQGIERAQGGLGIGLTLVRRLVELHSGRVEVMSEGVGQGSQFVVHLPLIEPPARRAAQPPKATEPRAEHPPSRILIVDDNEDAARTLSLLLRTYGHETALAFDGEEALTAAARFQPAVALLDLGLPRINGFELARRLRDLHPQTVLVAVSGYGQPEDRLRSKECGFAEHFVKPVGVDELVRFLRATAAGGK